MKLLSELSEKEFRAEMHKAGITPLTAKPEFNSNGDNLHGRVDATYKDWTFTRAWSYWIASGPSEILSPPDCRANGDCRPDRNASNYFHVDSVYGLQELVRSIR